MQIESYFLTERKNNSNCYENCSYYYYFDEYDNYRCTEICPIKFNKLIKFTNKCIDNCKNDDTFIYEYDNICYKECPNGTLLSESNEEYLCIEGDSLSNNDKAHINSAIKELIFNNLKNYNDSYLEKKDKILKKIQAVFNDGFNTNDIEKGEDLVLTEDEITYTITTTLNQNQKRNNNESTIHLGECEKKLIDKYNISKNESLYLLKVDAIIDNIPKVEYEVYYSFNNNNNFTKLDLSICKNIKIDISIPIVIPNKEIDKYNKSSDLYNNICYTLTTESRTDKSLKDRQNEYLNNNISACEEDCEFSQYDYLNNKAICSCFTKIKLPLISEIKVDKDKMVSNFKNIKNVGNFKNLNCIKLLFNKKNIFKNSANYIMIILLVLCIISLFIFLNYDYIKIICYINTLSEKKEENNIINLKKESEVDNNKNYNYNKRRRKQSINNKNNKNAEVNQKKSTEKKYQSLSLNINPVHQNNYFMNNSKNNQNNNKIIKTKRKKVKKKSKSIKKSNNNIIINNPDNSNSQFKIKSYRIKKRVF